MFISYEFIKYLGYDAKTKEHTWQYKITDSDFEEVGLGLEFEFEFEFGVGVGVAVIDTYEKRNLNVVANLMKAFIWYSKKYSYPIAEVITWNKKHNPKFAKYEKDLEKYLVLM